MEIPIEVFLSYAHQDESLAWELEKHLNILQRQELITYWYDGKISPGKDWLTEINRHLNTAQIILLLVSPAFIDSDFVWSTEMKRALERYRAGEASVIPIILRPTYWKDTPLGMLQALPKDGKPMTMWGSRDLAFLDVMRGIKQAIEETVVKSSVAPRSAAPERIFAGLEPSTQIKLEELANDLRKSYSYIRGYEDILRIADDPREKAQARLSIEKQGILTRHYLNEYETLANQLGVRIPPDIVQISSHLGDTQSRAIS